jgi:hypothetical protein
MLLTLPKNMDWSIIPAFILMGMNSYSNLTALPNYSPDEREQKELHRQAADYSTYIGFAALFGCLLLSFQDYFPTLWMPKTGNDWRAVFWLLASTGLGSQMIGERMRALPPLGEDAITI